jgi:hypothetical protein
MKRLIAIGAALLLALPVAEASAAKAAKGAKGATAAAKACKASKAAKKPKAATGKRSCAKTQPPKGKRSGKDPATLRAEQRCRAERARLGADFRRAWGGSAATAMARCVKQLRDDELNGPLADADDWEEDEDEEAWEDDADA